MWFLILEIFLPKIPAIIISEFWDFFAKFSGILGFFHDLKKYFSCL
jgi:hypothetical protein